MTYNWQQSDWPNFSYDLASLLDELMLFSRHAGRVSGMLEALPDDTRRETLIDTMVSEAIKTSEIEGEYLSRTDVMSSIRRNLGLQDSSPPTKDARAAGAADLIVDVRQNMASPLSEEMLFVWHRMLMRGNNRVLIGAWRAHKEPMQVISGPIGKEKIHFEAPPSSDVPGMMANYVTWYNETMPGGAGEITQAPIKSAIAHLYFESIHPFEDGNGRIGRAISEKALSQGLGRPVLMSLSKAIEANKKDYYNALQSAQRSNDITEWVKYFLGVCHAAQKDTEAQINFTLQKVKFFDRFGKDLNDRQIRVAQRMLDEGIQGFNGGMSASKYAAIAKTSKPTATRDLQELATLGAFIVTGGGRSTRYWLPFDPNRPNQSQSMRQKQ